MGNGGAGATLWKYLSAISSRRPPGQKEIFQAEGPMSCSTLSAGAPSAAIHQRPLWLGTPPYGVAQTSGGGSTLAPSRGVGVAILRWGFSFVFWAKPSTILSISFLFCKYEPIDPYCSCGCKNSRENARETSRQVGQAVHGCQWSAQKQYCADRLSCLPRYKD